MEDWQSEHERIMTGYGLDFPQAISHGGQSNPPPSHSSLIKNFLFCKNISTLSHSCTDGSSHPPPPTHFCIGTVESCKLQAWRLSRPLQWTTVCDFKDVWISHIKKFWKDIEAISDVKSTTKVTKLNL